MSVISRRSSSVNPLISDAIDNEVRRQTDGLELIAPKLQRVVEGASPRDVGLKMRPGHRIARPTGMCSEPTWPRRRNATTWTGRTV